MLYALFGVRATVIIIGRVNGNVNIDFLVGYGVGVVVGIVYAYLWWKKGLK